MKRKIEYILTVVLVLIVFGIGTKIVHAEETKDEDILQQQAEDYLMDEFDFSEIEKSLKEMFPEGKITFQDVLSSLMSGDIMDTGSIFLGFLRDQISYEFDYNRRNLVYVLLAALTASVFSNFADAFKSRQISDISFYVVYILLITLCLTSFQTASLGLEQKLTMLVDFMKVLCPAYFLAVAFASGSATSLFFYNMILLLIYIVELVIVRFILPVINIYIMVRVLENLTGEDSLSEFASLIRKMITWILRTLLACVAGINVVQGLLAPAIDTLKRSAITRTAEAIPWIGNLFGGATDLMLGTAILIKNGIGIAGALIAVAVCAVPVVQMLLTAFMYKLASAVIQPVSDKRIVSCISGISDGYEVMVHVILTSGMLFLLTIAVVAVSTS